MIKTWKLDVKGMTCDSCGAHVSKVLKPFTNVKDGIQVDWKSGAGLITSDTEVDPDAVKESIGKAGYSLVSITPLDSREVEAGESLKELDYRLIIIGGGSAGFAAAIQAAETGNTAFMVEQSTMGGTCVNVGCVPSKFLIHRSGLTDSGNWSSDMSNLVSGMRNTKYRDVLASYGDLITYTSGKAEIVDARTIRLEDDRLVTGGAIVIAAGSRPVLPEIPGADVTEILDSEALLALKSPPESLVILGGRFIALELGQAFHRLGSKVTILQRSERLIPNYEPEVSDAIREQLENDGIEITTGVTLKSIENRGIEKIVHYQQGGIDDQRSGTAVLSSLGRRGNTEELNLKAMGVNLDSTGRIITDRRLQAGTSGIFAAGDIVSSPALVYVAAKEGKIAALNAMGENGGDISLDIVPDVIFTSPQVARVGLTVNAAEARGLTVEKSVFPFSETPYAGVNEVSAGVIILVRDKETHQILGGAIVSPNAGDMIQTLTIAMEAGWTTERLQEVLFPYLTGVEGLKLAAITFSKDVAKLSCCAV